MYLPRPAPVKQFQFHRDRMGASGRVAAGARHTHARTASPHRSAPHRHSSGLLQQTNAANGMPATHAYRTGGRNLNTSECSSIVYDFLKFLDRRLRSGFINPGSVPSNEHSGASGNAICHKQLSSMALQFLILMLIQLNIMRPNSPHCSRLPAVRERHAMPAAQRHSGDGLNGSLPRGQGVDRRGCRGSLEASARDCRGSGPPGDLRTISFLCPSPAASPSSCEGAVTCIACDPVGLPHGC